MHPWNNIVFFSIYLFTFQAAICQIEEINFDRLTVNDGLSQSTVNAILQDRYGYMWFGTQDGLNRYDGYDFVVYKHDKDDSTSISDNWIWYIYEDQAGEMWVGTYNGGLNRHDRNKNEFIRYNYQRTDSNSLSANNVTCIAEDKKGTIWVGTWGGGLNRFDRNLNKFTRLGIDSKISKSLSNINVRCMIVDSEGFLWIGTWDGLNVYNPITQQFTHYKYYKNDPKSISGDRIINIFEDQNRNIWISTYAEGLNRFNREKNEFSRFHIGSNNVGQIAEDKDGILWIATRGDGLIRLNAESGKSSAISSDSRNYYGLSDETVYSVFADRLGGIWIGTSGNGINYYNVKKNKFRSYRSDANDNKGLNHPTVRAICEDRFGNLWVGTRGGGLNCYDKKTERFIYYTHTPHDKLSLSNNSVMALLKDKQGNFWIGTEMGGLDLFDRVNNRFIHHHNNVNDTNSISSNYIMAICEDRKGNLWVGTAGDGFNMFDPKNKKFIRYKRTGKHSDELSGNYVWSIMEDSEGYLWIGTWGVGLNRFNPATSTYKTYRYEPANLESLNSNTILSIYEDVRGNIWIGTMGGGLNRFNREMETFTHYTQKDGLPNDVVYGILEDANGNLWLSTNKGLSCFNPTTMEFKNYDLHDGLQSNEFNQGAYFKSKNGDLFFGGINGFNSFRPTEIKKNNNIPPIVITDFKVFDKPVRLSSSLETINEIQLSYKQNFFSFEFAALDYTIPGKNEYMYMLEGYDKDWIHSGTRRYAAYTNLDGGDFVFRVKGSNNDGVWNNEGRSVKIIITPPYWETWWARVIIALFVITLGYSFYRIRTAKMNKEKITQQELSKKFIEFQEHERKRIASELHDSLGQNLLIIKNALHQCEGNVTARNLTMEELHDISELAQESIDEVREISYDLHPHTLDRLGLRKAIQSCVKKFIQVSPIQFTYDADEIDKLFSQIEEIHIFRIIQEALNNVVKHSGASECNVSVKHKDGILNIQITDNGKGFEVDTVLIKGKNNEGFGISNIIERVKLLKGEIAVKSSPNNGAAIYIKIPIT
ncbi:MAG: two-component regulator propeller domain-containing protein [Bacteroidota bacterium]|nr:two-component regulator propeller domain-containing protein [Bacteroidota bacterium]